MNIQRILGDKKVMQDKHRELTERLREVLQVKDGVVPFEYGGRTHTARRISCNIAIDGSIHVSHDAIEIMEWLLT